MNNAVTILSEEKQRLENLVTMSSQKLQEIYAPAIVQRPSKDLQGQDVMVSYIDTDKFTPEERDMFDRYSRVTEGNRARLCVFENFVKGLVPKETVQSYNQYVSPISDFNGVPISCNNIDLDEKGEFSKFSIKVGPVNVDSPREMTVEEFSQLYTSSLSNVLIRSLGAGLSQEEAMQQLQNACAEVYLQQDKTKSL